MLEPMHMSSLCIPLLLVFSEPFMIYPLFEWIKISQNDPVSNTISSSEVILVDSHHMILY